MSVGELPQIPVRSSLVPESVWLDQTKLIAGSGAVESEQPTRSGKTEATRSDSVVPRTNTW